ncbi:MAG: murein lipoprotein [Pseudomonadota bacterium]|nr:murein lipoprotein [Pseudomonadota bacterium]
MPKVLLALISVALLGLSGCADLYVNKPADKPVAQATEPAKPTISGEAQAALDAAKADVKIAKDKNALWTTAESALKAAEDAAAKGDSATVIKQAKLASDHVKKGLAQLDYPMLKIGK